MRRLVLQAALAFASAFTFGQSSFFDNFVYQSWDSFDGLSGTTVTDVCQTQDGYINIGTYEGLIKFDGVEFNLLKRAKDNNYTFVSVRSIAEDSEGNIWLGSNDEGLHLFKDGTYQNFTMEQGLPNDSVRAIIQDKKNNIWVGTSSGIIYRTPEGRIINPQFEPGSVSKGILVTSIFCDTAGRIWLTTQNERGLFIFQDGLFRTLDDLNEYGDYTASAIAQDRAGNFWIGLGKKGLVRMNNLGMEKIKTGTILDSLSTLVIFQDPQGNIWFGTEKGLVVYSGGQYYEYKGQELRNAKVNRIICDRENNIWIATDKNGLGKLTKSKFKLIKTESTVNSIEQDRDGLVWAGTDTGLKCFNKDEEVHNKLTEFTRKLRIRDVHAAADGSILVSAYADEGEIIYRNGKIKTYSRADGLAGNEVRVSIQVPNGDIYAGTKTGLSLIRKDGTVRSFDKNDGLVNEFVMAIMYDSNGLLWIGTDGGGIYLMKDEQIISHISSEDGLAGNVIFKINQDYDGQYWICTGKGITICSRLNPDTLKPESCRIVNSDSGLGTDSVFQILKDATNNIWMVTNHGISSVPLAQFMQTAEGEKELSNVKYFNRNDGLDSRGVASTAKSIIDRHGRLWFTMADGIAIYDPVKVTENPVMPLVHIEKFIVDNVEYKNTRDTIVLKPGTKRIEIKFTGLSFDAPERIQFTHRLTNFEDDFSEPSTLRTISYTNLKPGKHVFYVNAINGDGFYSEQAEAVMFLQKPYFYQMPAFWMLTAFVVLSAIFIIFYLKQRAIKLENIRLEHKVQQRTQELKEAKDKSDRLLRSILPDKIAEELKDEIRSIGESFDDVTLLFSDIVNFTNTSSQYSADQIVNALNELFCKFDERAKAMGVEKIKTIGDAYMAACGVPTENPDHAIIMVNFAKGMYEDLAEYNRTARIPFALRIGLNCGPVTAGVIGKTKFIYDVWGNTVNVASRMETACTPGEIRVSESVYKHLFGTDVKFSEPIECNIKGKGLMTTYDIII